MSSSYERGSDRGEMTIRAMNVVYKMIYDIVKVMHVAVARDR